MDRPNFFQSTAQRIMGEVSASWAGTGLAFPTSMKELRAVEAVVAETLKQCVSAVLHHYIRDKIMAEFLGPAHETSGRPQWGSVLGKHVGKEFAEAHQLLDWLVPAVYKGDPFCTEEQRRKRQWLELAGEYGYKDVDAVRWAYCRWKEQGARVEPGHKRKKFGDRAVNEPPAVVRVNKTFDGVLAATERAFAPQPVYNAMVQGQNSEAVFLDMVARTEEVVAAAKEGDMEPFNKLLKEARATSAELYGPSEDSVGDDVPVPEKFAERVADHNGWVLGVEEGEVCNADLGQRNPNERCEGKMRVFNAADCTCNNPNSTPPCWGCSNSVVRCDTCDRESGASI